MSDAEENRRAAMERHRENKARLAFASTTFNARGAGTFEFKKCAQFGITFIERPFTMTGVFLDLDPLDVPEGWVAPAVTAMVVDWEQDENDFYTGAWCAISVDWHGAEPDIEDDIRVYVDFTWKGIAIKDVDPEVRA